MYLLLKRVFDVFASFFGLLFLSPLLALILIGIWLEDRGNPFYVATRVGRRGNFFKMVKFRSMRLNADKTGVSSTKNDDDRITKMGKIIRAYKLDEFIQLWNVLRGDMSLVGPRPQVEWAVKRYRPEERMLLMARPGITDLASIVFSDEGDILKSSVDPDRDYMRMIHPWKARLALLSVEKASFVLDLKIIFLTLLSLVDRRNVLSKISLLMKNLGADSRLLLAVERKSPQDLLQVPDEWKNVA